MTPKTAQEFWNEWLAAWRTARALAHKAFAKHVSRSGTQADSTVADDESRETVAEIVEWILEAPADQTPTPDDIVRRSIELIITNATLTEVGDRIRAESSREKRRAAEQEVRDAAEVYASQVTLTNTGASEDEIAKAIEGGIRELGQIFGGKK